MKASGKIGSNEVLVSDNVEKRFEPDIYTHKSLLPQGSQLSALVMALVSQVTFYETYIESVHICITH